jgi:SH3-like domain-containing protein
MHYIKTPRRSAKLLIQALVAVAALPFAPVHAEPMFVIDKVLINVYAEPNQDAARVTTLETGDSVEAVEQLDPYVRVRLPDGREGWVRGNYLSKQAPAILRLKELQSGQPPATQQEPSPQLMKELEELKKQRAALESEVARMRQEEVAQLRQDPPSKPVPPAPAATAKPKPVQAVAPPVADTQAAVRSRMWAWFAATVTAGALGFLLGYQTLATRIKRKYGNIKIY